MQFPQFFWAETHITLKMFVTGNAIPLFRIVYFKSCSEYLCIVVWLKGLCVCVCVWIRLFQCECVSPQRSPSLLVAAASLGIWFNFHVVMQGVWVNIWRVQLRVSHCSVALNTEWWGCIHGHVSISAPSVCRHAAGAHGGIVSLSLSLSLVAWS